MNNYKLSNKRSLIGRFYINLAIILSLIAGTVLMSSLYIAKQRALNELHDNMMGETSELIEILEIPLWNFNEKVISSIGESFVKNKNISSIIITDDKNNVLFESSDKHLTEIHEDNNSIFYQNKYIGNVNIKYSESLYDKSFQKYLMTYIVTIILMVIAVLAATYFLLRVFIEKPLKQFINNIEINNHQNVDEIGNISTFKELDPFVDTFDRFGGIIAKQFSELKAQEQKLIDAQSMAHLGSWEINLSTGDISCTDELFYIFGYKPGEIELTYDEFLNILTPKYRDVIKDALQNCVNDPESDISIECSGIKKDGSEIYLRIQGRLVENSTNLVTGTVLDITTIKQHEEEIRSLNIDLERRVEERTRELEESRDLLASAQKIAKIGSWSRNMVDDNVVWSDEQFRIYGLEPGVVEPVPDLAMSFIHPDDRDRVMQSIATSMKAEDRIYEEYRIIDVNGIIKDVVADGSIERDVNGKVTNLHGTVQDVSEQKKAQKKLAEAAQLNDAIIKTSPIGISIYNSEGSCLSANQSLCKILGATSEQMLNINFHELDSWKECGLFDRAINTLQTGRASHFELKAKTNFGKNIIVDCHMSVLNVDNKNNLLILFNDITEKKIIQDQLMHSAKMVTLGEMATGVAHELNQPLNIIRMAADSSIEILKDDKYSQDELIKKLDRISSQTIRAASIIDHMRIFGRRPNSEPAAFNPQAVVKEAIELISEQLRLSEINIKFEITEKCRTVLGDQMQLEQVVLNLISNAKDIIESKDIDDKQICINVVDDSVSNSIYIHVEDNGGGIDENNLSKIFDPFYTTKDPGKGTGLGLSISYGMVTDMGGTIDAINVNYGARFTISLPAITSSIN